MSELSEELDRFMALLRTGAPIEVAYHAIGLDVDRFEELLSSDEALRAGVERARAESEIANVILVSRAAREGNWLAAAWLLERQHPERWARPATRGEERPAPVGALPDSLDELAGRRQVRRGER